MVENFSMFCLDSENIDGAELKIGEVDNSMKTAIFIYESNIFRNAGVILDQTQLAELIKQLQKHQIRIR